MLFNLFDMIQKHSAKLVTGVVHLGAYVGEELPVYQEYGLPHDKILFIEANPVLFDRLAKNVEGKARCVNAAIGGKEPEKRTFHLVYSDDRTNMGCSSLLPLGKHAELYPACKKVGEIEVTTQSLDSLLFSGVVGDVTSLNLLVMDIQGAELLALQGAERYLQNADFIYTEFAKEPLYLGGTTLDELDRFCYNDFVRVETCFVEDGVWGDCLYVRKDVPRP